MDDFPLPPFLPPSRQDESTDTDVSGTYVPSRDRAIETLDDAAAVLAEASAKIQSTLGVDLVEPESIYRNESAVMVGQIDVELDDVEKEYAKRYMKVGDSLNSALTESYYQSFPVGYVIPTDEQLVESYDSGNFMPVLPPPTPPEPPAVGGVNPFQPRKPIISGLLIVNDVAWPSGAEGCGVSWTIPSPLPAPSTDGTTYYDYLEWVYSLGSPYGPGIYSPGGGLVQPPGDKSGTVYHPAGHWAARELNPWNVDSCVGNAPPPPPPPPPPTPPPPTPPPPAPSPLPDDAQCPVVDQCWEETAKQYFQKPYLLLSKDIQREIQYYCACKKIQDKIPIPIKPTPPKGSATLKWSSSIKPPEWCKSDIYEQLTDFANIITDPGVFLRGLFGIESDPNGGYKYTPWLEWMRGLRLVPEWVPQTITGVVDMFISLIHDAAKISHDVLGEGETVSIAADTIYNVFRLMHDWIGFPPGSWVRSWEKAVNFFGPEEPPRTSEAIEGWLNGAYHEEQRDAYIRAANDCLQPYERLAYGRRTRPNVTDCTMLMLQGKISEEEWIVRMRENGVVDPDDMTLFRKLVDQYPPVSDLIRFLVRDVADDAIVKKYSLDANFEQKWQGKLVEYATAQGLQEQEARYYWRAHWDFPSPTQLYNMLHRLRPGVVPDDVVVTEQDVAEALGVNDVNPYWQKRLMAVSYNPLTRTDTQRAFFIGAMTEDEVLASYQDGGYTKENAQILLRFTKKLRDNQRRSAAGLPGPKEIISTYVNALSGVKSTADALREFGWDEDLINRALTAADLKRSARLKAKKINRVKREYIRGSLSVQEASMQLATLDLDNQTIRYNLDSWDTEQGGKAKLPQAAQLCKWYGSGLLSAEEYQSKLYAIGYRGEDLKRVLAKCGLELDEKIAKQQQQAIEKAKREADKARKEAERKEKEAKKEAEKQKKEEEKRKKEAEKRSKEEGETGG